MSEQLDPSPERVRIANLYQRTITSAAVLTQRYDGHMALYRAACADDNSQEMSEQRELVLSIVSQILDNGATLQMLARQFEAAC